MGTALLLLKRLRCCTAATFPVPAPCIPAKKTLDTHNRSLLIFLSAVMRHCCLSSLCRPRSHSFVGAAAHHAPRRCFASMLSRILLKINTWNGHRFPFDRASHLLSIVCQERCPRGGLRCLAAGGWELAGSSDASDGAMRHITTFGFSVYDPNDLNHLWNQRLQEKGGGGAVPR